MFIKLLCSHPEGSTAYEEEGFRSDRALVEVLAFAILHIEKSNRFCVSFPSDTTWHFLVSRHFSVVELKVL